MGMTETPPTKWPAWKTGGATIVTFVALLYLIEISIANKTSFSQNSAKT
jgi:hypothetical protein